MDPADEARTAGALEGPPAPTGRRIPAEAWEARQAARKLLATAEEEAGRIRGRAAEEVAAARAAAFEAGRAEGHAEGLARAAARIALAAGERERLLAGCASEVISLAMEMAGRILAREVRPGEDAVDAARRALALLGEAPRVMLRVSPSDADGARRPGSGLGSAAGRLRILEDVQLRPGEVVVEAEGARLDGRYPTQLAELRRAIEAATGEGVA